MPGSTIGVPAGASVGLQSLMWRFYMRGFRGIPGALWDASGKWSRTLQLLLVAGILIPPLAQFISTFVSPNLNLVSVVSVGLLLGWGLLRANYIQFRQVEQLAERSVRELEEIRLRRPKFRLIDPIKFPDQTFQGLGFASVTGTLFRLGVANVGGVTAYGVSVTVTKSTPPIRGGLPTILLQTDDRATPPLREFDLPPGDSSPKLVDFVHSRSDDAGTIFMDSVLPDWDGKLVGQQFEIEVTVNAKTDSEPLTVSYRVLIYGGDLTVIPLGEVYPVSVA